MSVAKGGIRQSQRDVLFAGILLICGIIPFVTISRAGGWPLSHEAFHVVLETLGCMMALGVTALLLKRQGEKGNEYKLWLTCSMLSMAILDAFHASAAPDREFVWLRSIGRFELE
jgi:hypothetical protein